LPALVVCSPSLPALVVLASNLPALAVQPLLPLLALRRPALLKSPSAEPHFGPAFVEALARREPALGRGVATACWPGGREDLEAAVLPAVGPILAYGDEAAVKSLEHRAPGRVIAYGPKTSLAVLGKHVRAEEVAEGLARDVALFDQRGCLSLAAIYTAGDPHELAQHLAEALTALARRWPPGPADPADLAAVQQVRLEADLRGLHRPDLPISGGTVIIEPRPAFRPTPGLRTVRIHPLDDLASLPEALSPWKGRLQGAALSGADSRSLASALEELGFSRFAEPGELQSPDATWHNGGVDPLVALSI
jgi:acyl-CoA reductase LuxC